MYLNIVQQLLLLDNFFYLAKNKAKQQKLDNMLAVVDESTGHEDKLVGQAVLWQRIGKTYSSRELFDAQVKPLPGFEQEKGFQF